MPLCQGYCDTQIYNMESSQTYHNMLVNPVQFHKSLVRIAKGRLVAGIDIGLEDYFERYTGRDRYICSRYIGTADWNMLAQMCGGDVMKIIQLADSHNLSTEMLISNEEARKPLLNQLVLKYTGISNHVLPFSFISGTGFARNAYIGLVYCKLNSIDVSNDLWINAFPSKIWLLLLISLVSVVLYFGFAKATSLFDIVSCPLRQDFRSYGWKIILFDEFALFVRNLFESTLTSVGRVPSVPKLYPDRKTIISDNVEILVSQDLFGGSNYIAAKSRILDKAKWSTCHLTVMFPGKIMHPATLLTCP